MDDVSVREKAMQLAIAGRQSSDDVSRIIESAAKIECFLKTGNTNSESTEK